MIRLGSHRAHSVFAICLEVPSEKHCCSTVEKLLGSHELEPCPWDFLFIGKVKMLVMGKAGHFACYIFIKVLFSRETETRMVWFL